MPITTGSKTFKIPKGILKFKKTDSSEVNEADEFSPFDNRFHIYMSLIQEAVQIFLQEKKFQG